MPVPSDLDTSEGFQVFNGTDLAEQLGFVARSVVIDNRTSAYLFHPDSGRYVDPGIGAAFSFTGSRRARLVWKAPSGRVQPLAIPTEEAFAQFSANPAPPGAGYATPPPSAASGTAFAPGLRAVGTYDFTTPRTDAKGIIVYLHGFGGAGSVTVSVQDVDPSGNVPSSVLNELTSISVSGVGNNARIRVYPGLTAVANAVANDIMGGQMVIEAVVASAPYNFAVGYACIP